MRQVSFQCIHETASVGPLPLMVPYNVSNRATDPSPSIAPGSPCSSCNRGGPSARTPSWAVERSFWPSSSSSAFRWIVAHHRLALDHLDVDPLIQNLRLAVLLGGPP